MDGALNVKIALVCVSMNELGGKNVHLANLYKKLRQIGFSVKIVCCSKIEQRFRQIFLESGVFENDLFFVSRMNKWLIFPLIFELRALFIREKIDIVHTFQLESDVFGALAGKMAGAKSLVSIMESKVIPENISILKKFFYRFVNRIIRNWFFKTIAVSKQIEDELIQEGFRPEGSVQVIPIGLSIPHSVNGNFELIRLREKRPVIGTISRFSKEKALDRFIHSIPYVLEKIPKARFVLVGEGPEEEYLNEVARKLNIQDKIDIKPWTQNVYAELATFDIFVMTSLREGCPHTLLEAMIAERAVVASRIPGIMDIVSDHENGLLVDTSDSSVLAEKIVWLIEHPVESTLFAQQARKKVIQQFSIEREINQLAEIYSVSVQ